MTARGATPDSPCDVCGVKFGHGEQYWYHARLGVYVHALCAATNLVRGEDISTHTVMWGQVTDAPDTARPAAQDAPAAPRVGVGTSEGANGAQGGAGGLGAALRRHAGVTPEWSVVQPDEALLALADRADELEAAYRVADAEIARLGKFHDHYRDQVERVRALVSEWEARVRRGERVKLERDWAANAIRAALDGAQ